MVAGRRRRLNPTMRRELRRRSALEATIGHAKEHHRMRRNFLLGSLGDAINPNLPHDAYSSPQHDPHEH